MTGAEQERAKVVAWMRTEPAFGKSSLLTRLQLAWLFFSKPHAMVEKTSGLIADRIERGDHLGQTEEQPDA